MHSLLDKSAVRLLLEGELQQGSCTLVAGERMPQAFHDTLETAGGMPQRVGRLILVDEL